MDMNARKDIRRLLLIGLIAAVVTVLLGEVPIGWTVYPAVAGDPTGMLGMLIGSADLTMWQLALGVFFGGIAIPLQYCGFEGAARIVAASGNKKSARLMHWGALATAGLGGVVHVICIGLMFVCKYTDLTGMTGLGSIPQPVVDFTCWLVLPVSVAFMPVYYAMCAALFLAVIRGRTCLPRWSAALNPLTATLVINALPMLLPASPAVNALGMANMGVGSVVTFAGLLALLPHAPAKSESASA